MLDFNPYERLQLLGIKSEQFHLHPSPHLGFFYHEDLCGEAGVGLASMLLQSRWLFAERSLSCSSC